LTLLIFLLTLAGCAPHHPIDDMTLSTQVKIELLQDATLAAARLDVSSLNGVVTLSGTVPTQEAADRAVALARRVHGVRGVRSRLKLP
jgi:osmotically-inducible protein OsmY